MTVKDFLDLISGQAGVPGTDSALQMALSSSDANADIIPEELVAKIQSGILTLEAAKNHQGIKDHYKALHLGHVDNTQKRILKQAGYGEDEIREMFKAEKDTAKRNESVFSKISDKLASNQGGDDERVKSLTERVNALQSEKIELRNTYETQISNIKSSHLRGEIVRRVQGLVAGKPLPEGSDRSKFARLALNEIEDKHVLKIVDDSLAPFNKEEPEIRSIDPDKNTVLQIDELVDRALSPFYMKSTGGGKDPDRKPQEIETADVDPNTNLGRAHAKAVEVLENMQRNRK